MNVRLIIDGNNLLHLMHAYAMGKPIGRLALATLVGVHAAKSGRDATVVFDGPPPTGGLAQQFATTGVKVAFSGGRTADDVILDMLRNSGAGSGVDVVSSDRGVQGGARDFGAGVTSCETFAALLLASGEGGGTRRRSNRPRPPVSDKDEKPGPPSAPDADRWIRDFGAEELELPPDWQF